MNKKYDIMEINSYVPSNGKIILKYLNIINLSKYG